MIVEVKEGLWRGSTPKAAPNKAQIHLKPSAKGEIKTPIAFHSLHPIRRYCFRFPHRQVSLSTSFVPILSYLSV